VLRFSQQIPLAKPAADTWTTADSRLDNHDTLIHFAKAFTLELPTASQHGCCESRQPQSFCKKLLPTASQHGCQKWWRHATYSITIVSSATPYWFDLCSPSDHYRLLILTNIIIDQYSNDA
jgi:hypothetical protein